MRAIAAAVCAAVLAGPAAAQDGPKPGPEHEVLKKMAGTWDVTMSFGGAETKGSAVYKMDLGGLWLTTAFEGELFGTKFSGRGLDTYDPAAKKYRSVWVDSMSTSPLLMDGTYDAGKKTLTLEGTGPGQDGQPAKYKSVSVMPDDDTINFAMYTGGGADPAFTIKYKRKK